jgi:hypothetical protein
LQPFATLARNRALNKSSLCRQEAAAALGRLKQLEDALAAAREVRGATARFGCRGR